MLRLFFALLLCLAPPSAFARCDGTDLIETLPEDERAELIRQAAKTPYGEGLLWHARRDDTEITFFGTYHFEHERTLAHLEFLTPLIDRAERIYLEVSNDAQAELQHEMASDPSIMFITEGATLPDLLGEEDWQRLSQEMQARAIPGFMAAKFKPLWAAMMLGIGPCEAQASGYSLGGIDHRIGEYAASIGNDSRSLEDFRTLLTLFDGFPIEDQLDMIRLFFATAGNADDMAYTLRQSYLAQKTALIWEYSRMITLASGLAGAEQDFALFEEELLNRRNRAWIELMLREMPGTISFVAVGAAHLPGDDGVLKMLENEGFQITRLPFAG